MTSEFPGVSVGRAKLHHLPAVWAAQSFKEEKAWSRKIANRSLVLYQHFYGNFVIDPHRSPKTCWCTLLVSLCARQRNLWLKSWLQCSQRILPLTLIGPGFCLKSFIILLLNLTEASICIMLNRQQCTEVAGYLFHPLCYGKTPFRTHLTSQGWLPSTTLSFPGAAEPTLALHTPIPKLTGSLPTAFAGTVQAIPNLRVSLCFLSQDQQGRDGHLKAWLNTTCTKPVF